MSKKKEDPKAATNGETPLEALLLDVPEKRYPIVRVAVDWALVLKRKQENQHLKKNELLEKALGDVLSKRIDAETIAKELKTMEKEAADALEKEKEDAKPKLKLKTDEEETPKKKEKAAAKE